MSTKSTINHGEGWHLFTEFFDDENVYLSFTGKALQSFQVNQDNDHSYVMVSIPSAVWEAMQESPDQAFRRQSKIREYYRNHPDQTFKQKVLDFGDSETLEQAHTDYFPRVPKDTSLQTVNGIDIRGRVNNCLLVVEGVEVDSKGRACQMCHGYCPDREILKR